MLFRRAAFIITIIIAVLATLGLGLWFWKSQNTLYSSPTAVRTNDTYLRAHAPATHLPPHPTNLSATIRVQHDTNAIQIWTPGSFETPSEVDYAPLQVHHADSTYRINVHTGSVRLAWIATAFAPRGTNTDWHYDVPGNFYDAALRPLSREEIPAAIPEYQRKIDLDGQFPGVRFFFVASNLPAFKTLRMSAFDARTQFPLTQGYSSSSHGNMFWYQPDLYLWHQTPVELVLTLATGDSQDYSMPATPGAELKYPGGSLRLLATSPTEFNQHRSRSDGRTNHITFQGGTHYNNPYDKRPRSSFIFYSWPLASIRAEIEYYGHDGKKLDTFGMGSSGGVLHSRVHALPEDVKEIRLRYYPELHRLIFTIPEIPGLPEQNRNLKNLFDVHVPSMHFEYEYAFQHNISKLLQMQINSLPLTFPNGYFPTTRSNTSARELFLEMSSLYSNPEKRVVADPRKNVIEARPHPLRALVEKLKKTVGLED